MALRPAERVCMLDSPACHRRCIGLSASAVRTLQIDQTHLQQQGRAMIDHQACKIGNVSECARSEGAERDTAGWVVGALSPLGLPA